MALADFPRHPLTFGPRPVHPVSLRTGGSGTTQYPPNTERGAQGRYFQ
jgi:hypothetical protein